MSDVFSKEKRSEIMSKVRSSNTEPEIKVRKWLHKNGYRFRLHKKNLPGKPDIVLQKFKTVIFIHGCFWHRHKNCCKASSPQSNVNYWNEKFARNVNRDKVVLKSFQKLGWKVKILWECEVRDDSFKDDLINYFSRTNELP